MNYKTLAETDIKIPEIGLGTWNYEGGVEPLREGIRRGASLIDTAEGYYTEDVVGEAVSGVRDKVIIATKVSGRNLAYSDVLRSAENSLRKLNTDYIDLYQIHWPNPVHPLEETMKAMQALLDRGVVKHVGVSNFSAEEVEEAQHFLPHSKIVSNQVLYNLNSRGIEKELLPYCIENEITVMAYTPLDSGRLTDIGIQGTKDKYAVLKRIASQLGKTVAQVALNWCISQQNIIAIPKSDSVERTLENCGASGWYLDVEQIRALDEAFA